MICCWIIYDLFSMSWEKIFWGFIRDFFFNFFGFVKVDFLGSRWDFLNWWWIEYFCGSEFNTKNRINCSSLKPPLKTLKSLLKAHMVCCGNSNHHKKSIAIGYCEPNENCHIRTYNMYKVPPCLPKSIHISLSIIFYLF